MKSDKVISKCKERILNLVDNTIRFCWKHDEFLRYRQESIFSTKEFKSLPRWAKEYLNGYEDALVAQMWRKVVFSYIINENGVRATIESGAYRKISPNVISENYTDTGCYVWRSDPSKFWTPPKVI